MTVNDFVVQKLTTFNIAADGTRCRMNFISADVVIQRGRRGIKCFLDRQRVTSLIAGE